MAKKKNYRVEKVRRRYPRAYEPWSAEEDERLWAARGQSVPEIARAFQRQPGAIRSRLKKLGLGLGCVLHGVANTEEERRKPAAGAVFAKTPRTRKSGPWTPEEDEKLRRFAHLPVPALAGMLWRYPGSVEARLRKLGLQKAGSQQPVATVVEERLVPTGEPAPATEPVEVSPASQPAPASGGKPLRIWGLVLGAFAAGLLIGMIIGYFAGWDRSSHLTTAGPLAQAPQPVQKLAVGQEECLRIATWNIRGYPERQAEDTAWFHEQLTKLQAEVLCIQEIANERRLSALLESGAPYSQFVFADSNSGRDNAILATRDINLEGLDAPGGFQHPPQAAYVAYRGFDAVVVTVHLTWEPASRRHAEMRLLEPLVADLLQTDPDVMLVGDFNLRPEQARSLADRLGLVVLKGRNQAATGTLHSGSHYDYFLVSPDLSAEEAQGATVVVFEGADLEIARRVSDHRPLLAFFACDDRFRDRPLDDSPNE